MQPISLYLHIPFCAHRCGYCDFNTYAGLEALMPAYVEALIAESGFLAQAAGERLPVHTIFFGGGTPSLLPAAQVGLILDALRENYELSPGAEISLEANPGTLDQAKLHGLRKAGINRLSFGVQSSNPEELRLLERQHDFEDVIQAVSWARQAGFDNLNLDWIFGLPSQSLVSWQRNMELAISLHPEHLSLYALSIEHGTPFKELSNRGLLPEIDADLAADMYEFAAQVLGAAGYVQYEISNWAKPGPDGQPLACRHNLQYWRNLPYAGLGAGAHGFLGGQRTANVLAPAAYIQRLMAGKCHTFPRTPATASQEAVEAPREMAETMMMGLRLVQEGVPLDSFAGRFGQGMHQIFGAQITRLSSLGLLENTGSPHQTLRLTPRGRLLGNQVFMEFV
jgi:oxygen-independent coproporphyrinogen-3 oxidase